MGVGEEDDGLVLEDRPSNSSVIYQFRICHDEESTCISMESPCSCSGTLKFAHRGCVQRWCDEKGSTICEICLQECMASRSAKLAKLLLRNNQVDLSGDTADVKPFVLAARFCYGGDPELSAATVISVACVASALEMTESHCPNNLLSLAVNFLSLNVLPYWNDTIAALRAAEPVQSFAGRIGLIDACLRCITKNAISDARILSPREEDRTAALISSMSGGGHIRRRLFVPRDSTEDIISLPFSLFELAAEALSNAGLPENILGGCVYRYVEHWIYPRITEALSGEVPSISLYEQREMFESAESLIPNSKGVLQIAELVQLLRAAIFLQASSKCRVGIEARIAAQLPEASAGDLLFPASGYASETRYDLDCAERIVRSFLLRHRAARDVSALVAAANVVESFITSIASDRDLGKIRFVQMLELLVSMVDEINCSHDGLYRAVDVFLEAHEGLVESEREEICRRLEALRMSPEACEHAAQNERMPMRMVAAALFVGQLRIREAIAEVNLREEECEEEEEEEEEGNEQDEEKRVVEAVAAEEKVVVDMDEKNGGGEELRKKVKRRGWWKDLRDIFGCKIGSNVANNKVNAKEDV